METTLTEFQRNFRAARAAADSGQTVKVKSGESQYVFARVHEQPVHPFADLEPLFGVVRLPQHSGSTHDLVRNRLKTRRAG